MKTAYHDVGVDTEREEQGLKRLTDIIKETWPCGEVLGAVKLDIGYFANVIDLGHLGRERVGLAISADGVGSKVLIAQMMEKYDTIGIDCVAMNVNDLVCVGAKPLSMVDYIALQSPEPYLLAEIAKGLKDGAKLADISISGGEIAQLPDIVTGIRSGWGFDLAGMAVGTVPLDRILIGQSIREGDIIIGIESSGIHSNGVTLARRALLDKKGLKLDSKPQGLSCTLGEELLRPTHIYVREALDLLDHDLPVRAFIHVTSDGFLNLSRVAAEAGFVINDVPPIPQIFRLIQDCGEVADEEMFTVYNMGVGFCIVVDPSARERTLTLLKRHGRRASVIGHTVNDSRRRVWIPQYGLVGEGKHFRKD